jgi:hypothetical protein
MTEDGSRKSEVGNLLKSRELMFTSDFGLLT